MQRVICGLFRDQIVAAGDHPGDPELAGGGVLMNVV
jgi:hypothetical protein